MNRMYSFYKRTFLIFKIQQKTTKYIKKNENEIHIQTRKKSMESDLKMTQMLTLAYKDFKATIRIILKCFRNILV